MASTLLNINGVDIPNPLKGNLTISYNDKYNEITAENGRIAIEEIRTGRIEAAVRYGGLFSEELQTIKEAISLVSSITMYDALTGTVRTFDALVTKVQTSLVVHNDNVSAWGLSFNIKEL